MKLFVVLSSLVTVLGLRISQKEDSYLVLPGRERISGGQNVFENDPLYSYVAQIVTLDMFCSGAIISEKYIISVAHCFEEGHDGSEVQVRVGSKERGIGKLIPIQEIVMHPDHIYPENNLDIAYLKTAQDIEFSDSIKPAVLVDGPLPHHITVSGWGQRSSRPVLEDELRSVTLTTDVKDCQSAYKEVRLTANMFCAQVDTSVPHYEPDDSACKGDDGGPATNKFDLYGLYSFTKGCGRGSAPSVFTKLNSDMVQLFITEGTGVKYSKPTAE